MCIYDYAGVRQIFHDLCSALVRNSSSVESNNSYVPTSFNTCDQLVDFNSNRLASLRLLTAYLEISFELEEENLSYDKILSHSSTVGTVDLNTDAENETQEDSIDGDNDTGDDDYYEDSFDSSEFDEEEGDKIQNAKETINQVLKEVYPTVLRNICRLLAVDDASVLFESWKCLETIFKVGFSYLNASSIDK